MISKEAIYRQAEEDGPSVLPQVMNSEIISALKSEYVQLQSRYEDMSVTFYDEYPSVKALKARMDSVSRRIEAEENKVFLAIKNEYSATLKKVQNLQERVIEQRRLAVMLNEQATQYKIMEREVETNKEIYQSLLQRAKEIESMAGVTSSNINIVDKALLPILPFKPKVKMNLLLAIVIGFLAGVGLSFMLEYFSDTISDPEEIAGRFQIPILGATPFERNAEKNIDRIFTSDPRSPMAEALRTTKVSIQLSGSESQSKTFLVTSTKPNEGKSTLAVNLALAYAGAGEKVVLIDSDLRNPRIHKIFKSENLQPGPGISRYLAGFGDIGLVNPSEVDNLDIIPAGPIPPNPVELLASNRFEKLIRSLEEEYDRIILDGPPFLGFADVLVMGRQVGGIVLVCCMGETTRDALRDFKKNINNCHCNILGCVINKVDIHRKYGYQSYYKYYHDSGCSGLEKKEGEPSKLI
jgi:capsular exopolysaccharide synthesis family protein